MITVGVDLAAEPTDTAVAILRWSSQRCAVSSLRVGVADDELIAAMAGASKVGLDCPIGWPDAFVDFVVAHRDGRLPVPDRSSPGKVWRHPLANRHTDDVVRARYGLVPLSVSADRIARPAMRAAGLLARLADSGQPVERDGSGLVVEVYPAASLKHWGLRNRGYKGPGSAEALAALVADLMAEAEWLDPGEHLELMHASDHAFDAVIAALSARAASIGLTHPPTAEKAAVAAREGWIAVPTTPLAQLPDVTTTP